MIRYSEYKNLGYRAMPKEQFARCAAYAAAAVKKFTGGKAVILSDESKRGFCEICDLYYADNKSGGKLSGFTNDSYREQYFEGDGLEKRVFQIIRLYFPRELVFRGI